MAWWRVHASYNGLSPVQRKALNWTNADILSIGPLWTYIRENSTEIQHFTENEFQNVDAKM